MQQEMVERDCSVCGSDEKSILYPSKLPAEVHAKSVHSQYFSDDEEAWWRYQVVRCAKCRHHYASPVYKPQVIESAYSIQVHDNEFGVDERLVRATHHSYLRLIKKHLGQRRERMVDIGCDTGKFLQSAAVLKFRQRVGVEPSEHSVAQAEKKCASDESVEIIRGFFTPSTFAEGSVDLVTLIHVLDHLPNAASFIQSLQGILAEEGIVFVVVHNVRSLVARISGDSWHPFNLIHYDYYSAKSLEKLFRDAGFSIIGSYSTVNYLSMENILFRAPYLSASLKHRLTRLKVFSQMELKLPLGNIAIMARKRRGQA